MFSRIIPAGERPRGTRRTECFFCDGRSFLTWRHFVPNGCCVKIPLLVEQGAALPVCPECLGGLGVPRPPCEVRGGRVFNTEGRDCTLAFQAGAQLALNVAQTRGCREAILKARSPSCGYGRVYDGSFSGKLCDGSGVFASLLREKGVRIWTEENAPFELFAEVPHRKNSASEAFCWSHTAQAIRKARLHSDGCRLRFRSVSTCPPAGPILRKPCGSALPQRA